MKAPHLALLGFALVATGPAFAQVDEAEIEKRLESIEAQVNRMEQNINRLTAVFEKEELVARQRQKARERMRRDAKTYSAEQLEEIERLYQTANDREADPELVQQNLAQIVREFPAANRAGCAVLYLGQRSEGDERLEHLRRASTAHADCFYGNGVQVGPYAHWYLALHYRDSGDRAKAEEQLQIITEKYPEALNHRGAALSELMPRFFGDSP
ncbi:MAG: hypothetical protein AAGK14_11845 [Verrucomicrobiota bacterium]